MIANIIRGRRQIKTDVKANQLIAPIGETPAVPPPAPLRRGNPPLPVPGRPRSRKAPVNAHSAFQRARLRNRVHKKKGPRRYLNDVTVLGERVRLNEDGVSPQELARTADFSDFVYFTNKYFPPPTSEEGFAKLNTAKEVFSLIFHPAHGFNENEPLPPCADTDFSILKDCIEYRIGTLRDDVLRREQMYGVNVYTRQGVELFLRLEKVLNNLNSAEGCRSYDSNRGASSGRRIDNIDQARFENLLRQFSFLILQAMHPVKGYTEHGQIDPVDFVKQLETDPIRSDDFMVYLAEYEQSHTQIPPILAKVLDVTGTENGVFDLVLEGKTKQIYEDIEKIMLNTLRGNLLNDFQVEMAKVADLKYRERIQFSIKWLLEKYSGSIEQVAALQEERRAVGEERNQLQEEIGVLNGRQEALEGELVTATENQTAAIAAAAAAGPEIEAERAQAEAAEEQTAEAEQKAEEIIERLKAELLAVQEERREMDQRMIQTEGKLKGTEGKYSTEFKETHKMLAQTQAKLAEALAKGNYKDELYKLKGELSRGTTQKAILEAQTNTKISSIDRDIAALTGKRNDINTELTAKKSDPNPIQPVIADLEGKLRGTDASIQQKREELTRITTETTSKLAEIDRNIGPLDQQIRQLTEIIQSGEASTRQPRGMHIQHDKINHKFLKRKHDKVTNEIRRLENNIRLLEENPAQEGSTPTQIEMLKGQLEKAKGEEANLRTKLDDIAARMDIMLESGPSVAEPVQASSQASSQPVISPWGRLGQQQQQQGGAREEKTGLLGKVLEIAKEIESGKINEETHPLAEEKYKPFMNLYKTIMEYTDNIEENHIKSNDVCYINYFITFFIKQLFFSKPETKDKRDTLSLLMKEVDQSPVINDMKSLELLNNEMYLLLYSSETFFLKGHSESTGYYVLKDTGRPSTNILAKFYNSIKKNIDTEAISNTLETYLADAFPDYFFKGNTIQFTLPTGSSDADILNYPGFIFLRDSEYKSYDDLVKHYTVIKTSDYTKTDVSLHGGLKKNVINMVKNNKINYTLLFTLYILISRKYLVEIESTLKSYRCSVSGYIKNPLSIR